MPPPGQLDPLDPEAVGADRDELVADRVVGRQQRVHVIEVRDRTAAGQGVRRRAHLLAVDDRRLDQVDQAGLLLTAGQDNDTGFLGLVRSLFTGRGALERVFLEIVLRRDRGAERRHDPLLRHDRSVAESAGAHLGDVELGELAGVAPMHPLAALGDLGRNHLDRRGRRRARYLLLGRLDDREPHEAVQVVVGDMGLSRRQAEQQDQDGQEAALLHLILPLLTCHLAASSVKSPGFAGSSGATFATPL